MNESKRHVTLLDIANSANVSLRVVSAVMAGGDKRIRFSKATRDKVLSLAKEMNYRPNRAALSLSRKRHGNIGLLCSSLFLIPPVSLQVMFEMAMKRGVFLVIDGGPDPIILKEDCVDGLLMFDETSQEMDEAVAKLGVPVVSVNSKLGRPNSIAYEDRKAAFEATERLIRLGCENLCLMTAPLPALSHWSSERRGGFEEAVRKHGVKGVSVPREKTSGGDSRILSSFPKMDGILFERSDYAPPFFKAARNSGRRIPDDIQCIGMDVSSGEWPSYMHPALSCMSLQTKELARAAIGLIMELVEGGEDEFPPKLIPFAFQERESTRAEKVSCGRKANVEGKEV